MPFKPVDTAIKVLVGPAIDDADFKSREEAIAYDAAGMEVDVIVEKADGTVTTTAVTPTTGGDYDWAHTDQGYYELELPASGGASFNNTEEGILHVVACATGVLPFRSPGYDVVPAAVYNSLVKGTDRLEVDACEIEGSNASDQLEAACEAGIDDQFTFTGADVHATLDGEEVTTDSASREAAKADVSGLSTFDPETDDVHLGDSDLDAIKGSPDGRTVRDAYDKADTVLTRVEALVGTPVITDTAVSGTEQDVAHYRGDTAPIAFDLGRDITGAALEFTVKRRHSDAQGAALVTKTSAQSSEIEITDAEEGQFVVKLAADDTSGLLPDGRRATFVYDVEMTLGGVVETVAAGDFLLVPDVTTGS